jgi:hypothetical protein
MGELSDYERQDLLLYLLSKVDNVDSMTKLNSMVYIMNRDVGISEKYMFDAKFGTVYDKALDHDIGSLLCMGDIQPFPERELHWNRGLKVCGKGKAHLRFFGTGNKLEKILGRKLGELEKMMKKYSAMELGDVVLEADRAC